MDPGFPRISGFLAQEKVPIILTVRKQQIYEVVNERQLILYGTLSPEQSDDPSCVT